MRRLFAQHTFANIELVNTMAVSYTHLDVYKRQVYDRLVNKESLWKLINCILRIIFTSWLVEFTFNSERIYLL